MQVVTCRQEEHGGQELEGIFGQHKQSGLGDKDLAGYCERWLQDMKRPGKGVLEGAGTSTHQVLLMFASVVP